jgi:hypothetical protein
MGMHPAAITCGDAKALNSPAMDQAQRRRYPFLPFACLAAMLAIVGFTRVGTWGNRC